MVSFRRLSAITILIISNLVLSPDALFASSMSGQYNGHKFSVTQITDKLEVPWGMALVDNSHLIVTQRSGSLLLVNRFTGSTRKISGLPKVLAEGQGGLLDVAITHDATDIKWLYFTYSKPMSGGGATTLARAQLNNHWLTNWQDILVSDSQTSTSRHYGSRITFDQNGHVFFTVGDRGKRDYAQDLTNHAGTVLRLKLDGAIPEDNPFVGKKGVLPEIWSYGHRNPQGIAYDTTNQNLWLIEHGPRGGDEINLVNSGNNYGWPVISYGKEYWAPLAVGENTHKPGMEQPVKFYDPSIAPGSLLLYGGKAFPAWHNHLFSGALKLTHLNVVELNEGNEATSETRLLQSLNERIRSLLESPEGWIYLGTDSGKLLVLKPR